MSEVAGQSKYCVFCTNNPSGSSLHFVQLVDNLHPSEIEASKGWFSAIANGRMMPARVGKRQGNGQKGKSREETTGGS